MKKVVTAIAIIVVIGFMGFGVWYLTNSSPTSSEKPESITVGMEPNQVNALIIIADDQGYFTANGLNVTIKYYPSGAAAVNGMLKGEADIATSTEFVIVGEALAHEQISTFATIDKFQQIDIIGRNDRGIENASDLKGKTIGVPKKTASEFYLGRYLGLHNMGMQDVTLVDVAPMQSPDALLNGSVDAIVTWQPYIGTIEEQMGNSTVIWPAQSDQPAYCCVSSTDNWTSQHPEAIVDFLKSLDQAEKYSVDHPDNAKAIVQKRLHYDDAFITAIWPDHQFSLTLDQSLVLAMQDEGRWMIANNLTTAKTIPDYRNYVYKNGMQNVKPEAVNIIG